MSGAAELLVLVFSEESKVDEVMKTIWQMSQEGLISILNMAVLVKYKDGRTVMKETEDVKAPQGALFGAITGGLIGLIAGPAGAVVGAVAGATTGGVAAHAIDSGFPDDYLKELRANLRPGCSAIIILTEQIWSDRIIKALAKFQGHVIRHVLKEEIAAHLAAIGEIDQDNTPVAELPAKLERQITAWQSDIEALTAKIATNGTTNLSETRTRLATLRVKQWRAQEKLQELLTAEVQAWTAKIGALQAEAETAPAETKTELMAKLEATRAQRRIVREKLYAQIETRIETWLTEIEELQARVAAAKQEVKPELDARAVALQVYARAFREAALPETETEVNTRLAALQTQVETVEAGLQAELEAQIATWQAAIKDLQVYAAIPGIKDKVEVDTRMATLQDQVAAARDKLITRIETQITGWNSEIEALQVEAAAAGAAERAKLNEQIALLQAKIEVLQSLVAAAGAAERTKLNERITVLQAKVAAGQARLKAWRK